MIKQDSNSTLNDISNNIKDHASHIHGLHTKRSKIIAALIAVIVIFVLLIITLVVVRNNTGNPLGFNQTKHFKNWLQPATEIKVGNSRYVSPCQVLPKQSVEAAFGKLSEHTYVLEHYLDQSVGADDDEQSVSCYYGSTVQGESNPEVTLELRQYPDPTDSTFLGLSLGSIDDEDVQAELELYKQAVDKSNNQAAKDFLAKLEKSFAVYKDNESIENSDELSVSQLNALVIPVSDTLSGLLGKFAYVGMYNHIVYQITYNPAGSSAKRHVKDFSDKELIDALLSMKKATETVTKNIGNTSLDQSPAPTIMSGSTAKYGSTTVLEPCAILSPAVFKQLTGKQQNNTVKRTSVISGFASPQYGSTHKRLVLPRNGCDRQATEKSGAAYTYTYAWFNLQYGSSADQAKQWLEDEYKIDSGDETLKTDADWAVAFADSGRPGKFLYTFRTGPYIGNVTLYGKDANDDEIQASREQYVQAINTLTAGIKDAAQKAKQ